MAAVRASAWAGDPWLCSLGWAQYIAGTLDHGFEYALNQLGWFGEVRITRKADAELVRNDIRLPFLRELFGRPEIQSCKDLTRGEAMAMSDFMAMPDWVQVLGEWIAEQASE